LSKASEYLNLIVAYKNDKPVFLKNTECTDKLENDNFSSWIRKRGYGELTDGIIVIAVKCAVGAKIIELFRKIDDLLPVFKDP